MRLIHLLAIAICVSLSSTSTSAHFFPNISSIPPWKNASRSAWESFDNLTGCHAGENVDGLSKLKKYFHYFGYITNSSSNFTDDFDDDLKSAIETYQKNFNLNATGELDQQTLQHIVRPRCGVADIINGSTTMNSGKPSSHNTTHFHSVSHYSFFPGTPPPSWPANKRNLTYAFAPENQLSDEVKSVFARAFARWSAVTPLGFTEAESFNSADIKIGFYIGDHGDGEPFDGVLGTLAHAFSPPSGHFHLDGDESWVVSGDISTSSSTSAIDLESVAVHEIGHLLGLGHSSVEDSIMYPTISSRTRKVELVTDDIQGIQELYGVNPSYNGSSSTASAQERENSSSGSGTHSFGWGLKVLLAIGFGFLFL